MAGFPATWSPAGCPGDLTPSTHTYRLFTLLKSETPAEKNIWGVEKRDYTADWVPVNSPFVLLPRGVRC